MTHSFKITLGDGEDKKLKYLMDKHLHDSRQTEVRHLISTRYDQEIADEMKYAPKTSQRAISAEARDAAIAELENMDTMQLHAKLVAIHYLDPPAWTEPDFKDVQMSYECRVIDDVMTLGVLYEYKNGAKPNWSATLTLSEIIKELIKKKLI